MPGALDLNRGHRNEIRLDPTVRIGVLSKRRKRIKDADAVGRIQKILTERLALKNEFFVELFSKALDRSSALTALSSKALSSGVM